MTRRIRKTSTTGREIVKVNGDGSQFEAAPDLDAMLEEALQTPCEFHQVCGRDTQCPRTAVWIFRGRCVCRQDILLWLVCNEHKILFDEAQELKMYCKTYKRIMKAQNVSWIRL